VSRQCGAVDEFHLQDYDSRTRYADYGGLDRVSVLIHYCSTFVLQSVRFSATDSSLVSVKKDVSHGTQVNNIMCLQLLDLEEKLHGRELRIVDMERELKNLRSIEETQAKTIRQLEVDLGK
jgi:hypothetical protein